MAKRYNPSMPFDVSMKLLKPTTTVVKGVTKKTFRDPKDVTEVFFGSFRTFGGTENTSNNVYVLYDTATVDTWYNPEITGDCKIYICDTGEIYDVAGRPEDIGMRHQFMQLKLEKAGGKP